MPLAPHRWQALAPPAANVGLVLTVNGYDRTEFLADQSISIHVGTHGNSLGTLDAKLNDPSPDPASEDVVRAFADTLELYEGRVRSLQVDEWKIGTHHFVRLSAQDDGPDTGLPSAAPFGLSDTPNGTTTFGYRSLRKLVRTTEGGSPKTPSLPSFTDVCNREYRFVTFGAVTSFVSST